jgi:TM2 domain-containing membrane protein YozV
MRLLAFAALMLLGVHVHVVAAQSSYLVGQELNGKINVQITGTVNDGTGDYHPLSNHRLTLYRGATDSLQFSMDEVGIIQFSIAPGTYRIASTAPDVWHGRSYRWNIPLEVRRGMGVIALTADNASVTVASATTFSRAETVAAAQPVAVAYNRKDGSVGVLWSFLITGAGQMYAGKTGKGVGLLTLGLVSSVAGVAGLSASYNNSLYGEHDSAADAVAIGGITVALGTWIYSMASAPGDVRDYNTKRSQGLVARPVLDKHAGKTEIGLAVKF